MYLFFRLLQSGKAHLTGCIASLRHTLFFANQNTGIVGDPCALHRRGRSAYILLYRFHNDRCIKDLASEVNESTGKTYVKRLTVDTTKTAAASIVAAVFWLFCRAHATDGMHVILQFLNRDVEKTCSNGTIPHTADYTRRAAFFCDLNRKNNAAIMAMPMMSVTVSG